MTVPRYAIIPTHNRVEQVTALVKSLGEQGCHHVIVIENTTTPVLSSLWFRTHAGLGATIVHDDEQPPNLYRLWNRGFDLVATTAKVLGQPEWNVVVLNDDAELPDGWLDYVCQPLEGDRARKPAISCTYPYGNVANPLLKTQPDGSVNAKMCAWAFVVRGEIGLRADEEFRWWWGDNAFEYLAFKSGGVLLLPGYTTKNLFANSTTVGELAEQAGRDGETFARKWGSRPW